MPKILYYIVLYYCDYVSHRSSYQISFARILGGMQKGGERRGMRTLLSGDIKRRSTMFLGIRRHSAFVLRHITLEKSFNAVLCLLEMIMRRSFLHSHPLYLRIEVCPYCNLRCPGCLLGGLNISESNPDHRAKGLMKYDLFVDSIRDFLPYIFKVNLYDEGEPLLNNEIFEMIEFLTAHNVGTCVSSNFSLDLSDATLERILDCGLGHLIVPIEGATQESYSRYRKGGNLNLVIDNIRRLLLLKSAKTKCALKVVLQFAEFGDNREEMADVYKLAKELGVWRFTVIEGSSRDGWMGLRFGGTQVERRKRGCFSTWMTTTINSIGELGTCDYGEDNGIPNIGLAKDYISTGLRNHPTLIHLRGSFGDGSAPLNEICKHCSVYQR